MTASLENKLVSKFYFYNFRFYLFRSVNINLEINIFVKTPDGLDFIDTDILNDFQFDVSSIPGLFSNNR